MVAIVGVYQTSRFVQLGDPFDNAAHIWALQQALGWTPEPALQAWVLDRPALVRFLAWYYMPMHLVPLLALFAWHLVRRTPEYPFFRAAAVVTIVPSFLMFMVFPLAPPRLVPEVGVVDLVGRAGSITLTTPWIASGANAYAAFPSNHVVWAVVVGWALVRLHSPKWFPLVFLHLVVTMVGVVAMGHHYVVDVLAGLVFAGATVGLVDLALWTPHQASNGSRTAPEPLSPGTPRTPEERPNLRK